MARQLEWLRSMAVLLLGFSNGFGIANSRRAAVAMTADVCLRPEERCCTAEHAAVTAAH